MRVYKYNEGYYVICEITGLCTNIISSHDIIFNNVRFFAIEPVDIDILYLAVTS